MIEGEGGIGKTTLAERFLALHPEARVLRASGDESERGVSFAVIDQLLRSAGIDTFDALGPTQHLTVGLELLDRLGAADEPRRTVVVIDDAHLADADSLRALLFCARRLSESATLFVLVVRGSASDVLPEGWLKLADETRHPAATADARRRARDQRGARRAADRRRGRAADRAHGRQPAAPARGPA